MSAITQPTLRQTTSSNHLAETEPMMAQALHIFEDSLGVDYPSSVKVRNNLAVFLETMDS
jgi:hypothetical protein